MARKFKDVNVNVYRSDKYPLIVINWIWEESVIPLNRILIDIYRGESPEEMELIASGINAAQGDKYEDHGPRMITKHRTYHYKLTATDTKTGKVCSSKIHTWEGELDYVGLYIIEEHEFLFRHVSGTPCLIFKKQTDGEARCSECWDSISKRITKSNCLTCHGTGFTGRGVGGYYNPSYTWLDLSPDPEVVQLTQWGKVEPTQTDAFLTNYPRLSVGDLVIELLTDKRWKVVNVRDTEKNRVKLLQIARLDLLDPDEVEYRVPIDETYIETARAQINERRRIPEF